MVQKNSDQKKILVQTKVNKQFIFCLMVTDCNASACANNWGWKDFPTMFYDFSKNVQGLQCQERLQIEAYCSIWVMATDWNASAPAKNWGGKLSKQCPMTFPTMFQACSVYKSCKRMYSSSFGNYSGSARVGSIWLTCD